jgi:tetratricopeptide (TPR) repeat protein
LTGENTSVEFFPPFEVIRNFSEIHRYLIKAELSNDRNNMFAWEYLKDHLDLCAYLVSSRSVQIVPPIIPISNLAYFQKGVRRVYLSATMLGLDSFIRTFGQQLDYVVKPDTPAGQCERLIIFPEQVYGVEDDRATTKEFIKDRKALVLAPSNYIAEQWKEIGHIPKRDTMIESLDSFKRSSGNDKLILAARYDGIDLPGDTCRHLILDGLPTGTGLLDRYMWESLRLSNILRSTLACRIVQSLGRISRGMSDYGVVIVLGREYVKWFLTPRNQAYLPPFVQKQIKLGLQVSETCHSSDDITAAANACLTRDRNWIDAYEQYLNDCETGEVDVADEILIDLAIAENKFIKKYWDRNYAEAIKILEDILEPAFSFSSSLGSWYALWIGYCFDRINDKETALIYYKRANGATKNIPKFFDEGIDLTIAPSSTQASNIANEFLINKGASVSTPKKLHSNLNALNGESTVKQTEEAIRWLGQYLGLDASRPDNEHGTGPDVLWICNDSALVIEAKTDKESEYKKEEIGQLSDHMQWVENNFPGNNKIPVFVGPNIGATKTTNPSEEVVVIELSELQNLSRILAAAYEDIAKRAVPLNLIQVIEEVLKERILIWPDLLNNLKKLKLKEI